MYTVYVYIDWWGMKATVLNQTETGMVGDLMWDCTKKSI